MPSNQETTTRMSEWDIVWTAAMIQANPRYRELEREPDDDLELGDRVSIWMFAPSPYGNNPSLDREDLPDE